MDVATKYPRLLRQALSLRAKKSVDLSLMTKAASLLGNPHLDLRYIHVTGTNGKGTVCWRLANILQEYGLKVGLFTSPHIACYRERFRINGEMIDEGSLMVHLEKVLAMAQDNGLLQDMSFFDVAVLVSFLHFREQAVDVVVMEVGIGGRLDPTNIIPPSYLAVLTSVAIEHTYYLGNTVESIAWEKSHIIKSKMPAVIGPRVPLPVVQERANEVQATLYVAPAAADGDFDTENRGVVDLCISALQRHYDIFKNLRPSASVLASMPPCRFEVFTEEQLRTLCDFAALPSAVVFDVGHNPDALLKLFHRLRQRFPGKRLVGMIGCSTDKDISSVSHIYAESLSSIHVVPVSHFRLMKCQELYDQLTELVKDTECTVHMYEEGGGDEVAKCKAALQQCLATAGNKDHVVLIVGSFFIMHAMRAALGIVDPCDPPC